MVISSAGTTLSADTNQTWGGGGGGAGVPYALPFSIIAGYPADNIPRLRVHGESYISNIETGGTFPITGLGAIPGSAEDTEEDPGQFDIPAVGDSIWLEATVDGFDITSASIWTGKAGLDGWENYPDPIKLEQLPGGGNYAVTATRVIIGHIIDGADPRKGDSYSIPGATEGEYEVRKVLQCLTTNLGLQALMMRGVVAPVLVPWHGPFGVE
jgi:hypothetical protein